MLFNPKHQVAYIPAHAKGDINLPHVEYGFVTSVNEDGTAAYVRYWRKKPVGGHAELRTKSNSELTPVEYLVSYRSVNPTLIAQVWKRYVMVG